MSFWKKAKRAARHYMSMKAVRKKIGLTGKSKFLRQSKRRIHRKSSSAVFGGSVPTSAGNFQSRSISQLMGGV